MKYKVIAICGKAGAGKDTLLKELIKQDPSLNEIISYTTRPPREGEVDGINYHFITEEQYDKKLRNREFLEGNAFRDWYYGTGWDSLDADKINIGVFNPTGVETMLGISDIDLLPIIVECSDKTRMLRQLNREENPDVREIVRRFGTDENDFDAFYEYIDLYYSQSPIWTCKNGEGSRMPVLAEQILQVLGGFWTEK